jgi:hypothetical protein
LHHRDRDIVSGSGNADHVHATEAGAPQPDPAVVDFLPRLQVLERRRDVVTLFARRDMLARLTVGSSGIAVVERQGRDSGRREVLFVLSQHHVVRRAQSVHQHYGGMRSRPGRQRQPRRASDATAGEINPLGRNGRGHARLLYKYGVRIRYSASRTAYLSRRR